MSTVINLYKYFKIIPLDSVSWDVKTNSDRYVLIWIAVTAYTDLHHDQFLLQMGWDMLAKLASFNSENHKGSIHPNVLQKNLTQQ